MLLFSGSNRRVPLTKESACRDRNNTELRVREIRLYGTTSKKRDPKAGPYKFQDGFDCRHFLDVAQTNSAWSQQSLYQNIGCQRRRGKENFAAEIFRAKELFLRESMTGSGDNHQFFGEQLGILKMSIAVPLSENRYVELFGKQRMGNVFDFPGHDLEFDERKASVEFSQNIGDPLVAGSTLRCEPDRPQRLGEILRKVQFRTFKFGQNQSRGS